jgi:predicted transposase YdaD
MKTDKLFYRLFLSQPGLIAELIPEIPIRYSLQIVTSSASKTAISRGFIAIDRFESKSIIIV